MPSQILHLLFGEDLLEAVYENLKPRFGALAEEAWMKVKKDYWPAFALGCQGPDIFYHSQSSRPVALEYGTLLHRRGCGIFTAALLKMALPGVPPSEQEMRRYRREFALHAGALPASQKITALGAYALGFMTHAILDRAAHPYIVYKAARHHAFFERILDLLMLRLLRGLDVYGWDQDLFLARICDTPPEGLPELLAKALVAAFPERAGKDEKLTLRMDNAFFDAARFYRLTNPRKTALRNRGGEGAGETAWALNYIYPEKIPLDIDYLNLAGAPWRDPGSGTTVSRVSFPELYRRAVEEAAGQLSPFIARYLGEGIFPITEAARSIGNGSLSIQDKDGKPCAPRCFDFLPLDRVLKGQEKLRNAHV
jgi:hypothetical protein